MTDYDKIKSNRTEAISEKEFNKTTKSSNVTIEEPPQAEQLKLKGNTNIKKANLFMRTVHAIFPNGFKGIGDYLAHDVVVPAIKDMMWQAGSSALQAGSSALSMLIYRDTYHTGSSSNIRYGGSGGWNTPTVRNYNNRTNYSNSYTHAQSQAEMSMSPEDSFEDFVEVEFDNREDAIYVFNKVDEWVRRYGRIPVAEYYRMVDPTIVTSYTMRSYGWNNLSGTRVRPTRGGKYIIDFPPLIDLQI